MKIIAAGLILPLLLFGCSKAPEKPLTNASALSHAVAWIKPEGANVDPLFAQARAARKPVFLYWGAVWCPPCNQIKATVFSRQDFIDRSQLFVPVYLDGDSAGAQQLGARFKVRGYPTMILLRPDGTELTRLPGEVDASRYMELLNLGLAASRSVKESLAAVLAGQAAALGDQDWRMLAYYAWEQDEAQLVAPDGRAATLAQLAKACPAQQRSAASRLALLAMAATAQAKAQLPEPAAALDRVRDILGDAAAARENFDLLVAHGADLVPLLNPGAGAEREALLALWSTALQRFAADATLSTADRLSAVSAQVALARLEASGQDWHKLPEALRARAREAVAAADKAAVSPYERQAVVPDAADLLTQVGQFDESDRMLRAELPRALSPYYHMLVLAANAKARGDSAAALDWSRQAWEQSVGPATRRQWGVGYLSRLLDATPLDEAGIERAASALLAEVAPVPESFFERNGRGLHKLGERLQAWNAKGQHAAVLRRLSAQFDAVCVRLPDSGESRAACAGVLRPRPAVGKV